jgi:hypothetical protein
MKETYLKPEMTSEVLEPETLLVAGSSVQSGPFQIINPWFGFCCD